MKIAARPITEAPSETPRTGLPNQARLPTVAQSPCLVRLPDEGSRRAPCFLQIPNGALEPPAHHQHNSKHLRDDPTAASPHEGERIEESQPRDDGQARRVSGTSLATPQRKPSTHARHPRTNLHRRSPAERRLIHASRTQHLTRAPPCPSSTTTLRRRSILPPPSQPARGRAKAGDRVRSDSPPPSGVGWPLPADPGVPEGPPDSLTMEALSFPRDRLVGEHWGGRSIGPIVTEVGGNLRTLPECGVGMPTHDSDVLEWESRARRS